MTTPGLGDIVYLCSTIVKMAVSAETTAPDTPNLYSADMKVMGDAGDLSLDAVEGPPGPDGQILFGLRDATKLGYEPVDSPVDLPILSDLPQYVGLYWLIDELDDHGHILNEWAYIWWGTYYRQIMMGVAGKPGSVPNVDVLMTAVDPSLPAQVLTSGGLLNPTWDFQIPAPIGAPGPVGPLYGFPDVDEVTVAPATSNVLACTSDVTSGGLSVWKPFDIEQYLPQTYSMPQGDFSPYTGVAQQAPIGSFTLPAQTFPWTPLVWGHMSAGGLSISANPLMVGCQVLLNDQFAGKQVARGIGNTLGVINVMPHYSTPGDPTANITPTNQKAIVPAGQTATLFTNLYNDGQLGFYDFRPTYDPPEFQKYLNDLIENLLVASSNPQATVQGTINNVVSLMQNWVGAIPAQIQQSMNSVVALVGETPVIGAPVEATINSVAQALTNFVPTVNSLATALGIPTLGQTMSGIINTLQTWTSTITTNIQNTIDSVANSFGFPGFGHPLDTVVSSLQTLQPTLDTLTEFFGGKWINTALSAIAAFVGTVTTPIQNALDGISQALGFTGTGHTLVNVNGYLTDFQTNLDGVISALGISKVGNTIYEVLSVAAPFVQGVIGGTVTTAIRTLLDFLHQTGLDATVLNLISQLLALLGDIFSGYTTDAQLFVTVLPMLEG